MPKYMIALESDSDKDVAKVLVALAGTIKAGLLEAAGVSQNGTQWHYTCIPDDDYPHGDYRDEEGNLLHVSDDTVVSVTFANGEAETEETDIPVDEWIEEHGMIVPAREAEATLYRDASGSKIWVLGGMVIKAQSPGDGPIIDGIVGMPLEAWIERFGAVEEIDDEDD